VLIGGKRIRTECEQFLHDVETSPKGRVMQRRIAQVAGLVHVRTCGRKNLYVLKRSPLRRHVERSVPFESPLVNVSERCVLELGHF